MRGRGEGACQLLLRWLDSYFPLTLLSFLGIGLREGGGAKGGDVQQKCSVGWRGAWMGLIEVHGSLDTENGWNRIHKSAWKGEAACMIWLDWIGEMFGVLLYCYVLAN